MKRISLVNDILTKSMVITSKKIKHNARIFQVRNQSGKDICHFTLKNDGEIESLELSKKYRRKKEGVCALLAAKKFLEKLGKKEHIDYYTFWAKESNHNNVVRLYDRFAIQMQGDTPSYFWPLSSKGRKHAHKAQQELPIPFEYYWLSKLWPF